MDVGRVVGHAFGPWCLRHIGCGCGRSGGRVFFGEVGIGVVKRIYGGGCHDCGGRLSRGGEGRWEKVRREMEKVDRLVFNGFGKILIRLRNPTAFRFLGYGRGRGHGQVFCRIEGHHAFP